MFLNSGSGNVSPFKLLFAPINDNLVASVSILYLHQFEEYHHKQGFLNANSISK